MPAIVRPLVLSLLMCLLTAAPASAQIEPPSLDTGAMSFLSRE